MICQAIGRLDLDKPENSRLANVVLLAVWVTIRKYLTFPNTNELQRHRHNVMNIDTKTKRSEN